MKSSDLAEFYPNLTLVFAVIGKALVNRSNSPKFKTLGARGIILTLMSSQAHPTPKTHSGWKSILKKAWPTIRVLLSVALLSKATSGLDWRSLFDTHIQMQPLWFLEALASMMLAFICGGYRWGLFMQRVGFPRRIRSYIGLYFAGGLINQGLPSTLGGDSYRAITATHLTSTGNLSETKELDDELHHSVDLEHATPKLRLSFSMVLVDRLLV